MTLLAGASSFVVGNAYQAQMPEFAADLGHDHADFHYTMLFAANAAGALVAGLVLEDLQSVAGEAEDRRHPGRDLVPVHRRLRRVRQFRAVVRAVVRRRASSISRSAP